MSGGVNKSEVIKKYQNGATLTSLAEENKCTVDTIRYLLQKHNVWKPAKLAKCNLPEREIVDLYKSDISVKEIADKYNVSESPIVSVLTKHKIRKPNWLKKLPYSLYEKVLNREYIVSLFNECVTQSNVMKKLNCGQGMVVSLCEYHGIELPNSAIQRSLLHQKERGSVNLTKENFVELYINQRKSLEEVSKLFGVSVGYLRKVNNEEWKVETRPFHDTRTTLEYQKLKNNLELLREMYLDKNKSCVQIAREVGCWPENIRKTLKECGIFRTREDRENEHFLKLDFESIKNLHYQERMSIRDISNQFNIPETFIYDQFKKHNNSPLKGGELTSSVKFLGLRDKKEELENLLLTEKKTLLEVSNLYDCSPSAIQHLAKKHNIDIPIKYRSTNEKYIEETIRRSLPETEIDVCNRTLIPPQEIDIYLPEYNLAIEYCGLYWHSELNGKDKNYHLNKLEKCQEKSIRLLTIFEDEFEKMPELVINRIKQSLGVFSGEKIHARKCSIKPISCNMKNDFLDRFHLQGKDISKVYLGLFYNNILVSVMTFSRPSRSRASQKMLENELLWELNRFATDYRYVVRGGAGKLLNYFKNNYQWSTIYSYADRRWSEGDMYYSLGFKLGRVSKPNYWYVSNNCKQREYRYKYTKQSLVNQGYNSDLTEKQIMEDQGFTRIWDCGMLKFEMCRNK